MDQNKSTPATPGIEPTRVRTGQWMALTAALLGWMFDGFEMGVFSLVARPALRQLLPQNDEADVGFWIGVITAGFLVGAATGGVLFGWLGDRIGRVRAMSLSILTYAVFTGLCGIANTAEQVGALRFIASLGMGGEWSLGVALVMEVWPNRSRAFLAGLIGAAANVGYLLVAGLGLALNEVIGDVSAGMLALGFSQSWVTHLTGYQGWRLLMLMGTAPALLTFLIRLFVPESKRWQQEKLEGRTSNWATWDLLAVVVGGLGPALIVFVWANHFGDTWTVPARIVGSLVGLAVATAGYSYPVIRYLQRQSVVNGVVAIEWRPTLRRMYLAALLSGIALLGTWGSMQWAPAWADMLTDGAVPNAKAYTQICAATGAILGTILAAMMGDWFGRRITYCLMCITSIGSILLLYQGNTEYGTMFLASCFVAGLCTASFYGWLPLYLPELFPTAVRATGQGFGFNFGRILAAVGALQTGNLMSQFAGGYPQACTVMALIYLLGPIVIWFAPETRGRPLPD